MQDTIKVIPLQIISIGVNKKIDYRTSFFRSDDMTVEDFKEDLIRIGHDNPELLVHKLEKVGLTKQELSIMKLRYIDGLFIKQIPEYVQAEERWVKKLHSRAIIKTLDGLYDEDLLELGVHHKFTLRTLYLH